MGQTYQSIMIEAPADEVWAVIRNFHDMSWSPNVVTDLKIVGDIGGDQAGAGRILNDAFHETLRELDDDSYEFSYTIDDGPSPISSADVSDYIGRVSVRPVTEGRGSFVEWSSTWEKNDEAAGEFCHGIYVALLADMKKRLEG
jgi:Polyketide cyclase / dehydrase and lipid transport